MAVAVEALPADSVTSTSDTAARSSVAVTVTVPASSPALLFVASVVRVRVVGGALGVPAPVSQPLVPAAFLARTRTRYDAPFSSPAISCVTAGGSVSAPRLAATQPALASLPDASASSATAPSPVSGAAV